MACIYAGIPVAIPGPADQISKTKIILEIVGHSVLVFLQSGWSDITQRLLVGPPTRIFAVKSFCAYMANFWLNGTNVEKKHFSA